MDTLSRHHLKETGDGCNLEVNEIQLFFEVGLKDVLDLRVMNFLLATEDQITLW